MAHLIGKPAPSFTATAVLKGEFKNVTLSDYRGKLLVLFFYPMDFTRVCASEIAAIMEQLSEFKKRSCEVVAVSCDSHFTHLAWIKQLMVEKDLVDVGIPLLADKTGKIARDFDVYNQDEGVSSRALFIIDRDQVIRDMSINDRRVGRSIEEILILIDALGLENKTDKLQRGLKRPLPCDIEEQPLKSSKKEETAVLVH